MWERRGGYERVEVRRGEVRKWTDVPLQAQKAEAEQRDYLAQEKAAREAEAAEEQWQSLTTGLLGLKLTIPAPASIAWTTSGSSTQSKGKRKVTEEGPSTS
jgi:hypothetical protein